MKLQGENIGEMLLDMDLGNVLRDLTLQVQVRKARGLMEFHLMKDSG